MKYILNFYDNELTLLKKEPVKFNITHRDNCPAQYKCRQHFLQLSQESSHVGQTLIHNFAQKYGFQGSWGACEKLVKHAIMKNEIEKDRCANVFNCYVKLSRDLTKTGSEQHAKIWEEWE